jgi:hypothetical protein
MPTLPDNTRNAAINAMVDLVDQGTTNPSGQLVVETAGAAEIATCAMSNPAFGDGASGTATAAAITPDTNANAGTIGNVAMQDRDGNDVMEFTVGTSGADINFSSLTVNSGDTVSFTSLTITQPA